MGSWLAHHFCLLYADGETKGAAGGEVVQAVFHFVFLPGWVDRLASSQVMVTESIEKIV